MTPIGVVRLKWLKGRALNDLVLLLFLQFCHVMYIMDRYFSEMKASDSLRVKTSLLWREL